MLAFYELTPLSTVLLEKLTVAQLDKIFFQYHRSM